MTYSKELYDDDLKKYQEELEQTRADGAKGFEAKFYLLLAITQARLDNFLDYTNKRS